MAKLPIYGKGGVIVATALVDDDDVARVARWRWSRNPRTGYARRTQTRNGKPSNVLMHRLLVGAVTGDGLVVKHRNGNLLDNRRSNLLVLSGGR